MQTEPSCSPSNLTGAAGVPAHLDCHNQESPVAPETQELTWQLLDGIIERKQREKLAEILNHCEISRREYVDVIQLHWDLLALFGNHPALTT